MSTTIYNIDLDMVLLEKVIMRAVLAAVTYNCVLVQIKQRRNISLTEGRGNFCSSPSLYPPPSFSIAQFRFGRRAKFRIFLSCPKPHGTRHLNNSYIMGLYEVRIYELCHICVLVNKYYRNASYFLNTNLSVSITMDIPFTRL